MSDADRHEQGMQLRRAVMGDEHVDRAVEGTTAFTEDFQDSRSTPSSTRANTNAAHCDCGSAGSRDR
jgi:hypothetical protein